MRSLHHFPFNNDFQRTRIKKWDNTTLDMFKENFHLAEIEIFIENMNCTSVSVEETTHFLSNVMINSAKETERCPNQKREKACATF